jgi:hypothetical protein
VRRLAATIAPVRQAVTLLRNRLAGPAFAGRVCERGAVSEAAVAVFFATGPETYTSSSSGGSPWMRSGCWGAAEAGEVVARIRALQGDPAAMEQLVVSRTTISVT